MTPYTLVGGKTPTRGSEADVPILQKQSYNPLILKILVRTVKQIPPTPSKTMPPPLSLYYVLYLLDLVIRSF